MNTVIEWLDGKKLYITAIAVAVIAGLQYAGITIPEYVYTILGAFGIVGLKSAIAKTQL